MPATARFPPAPSTEAPAFFLIAAISRHVRCKRRDSHQGPKHPLPDVQGNRWVQVTPLLGTHAMGIEGLRICPAAKRTLLAFSGTPFINQELDLKNYDQ
jgi:hypothetical protein